MKLIIATNNEGKVVEIKKLVQGLYDEVLSLKDAGIKVNVVEDADSFAGNAKLKSTQVSLLTDCDVLADDSGICVEALGGAPGVHSARFAGEDATDEQNNTLLIESLAGKENRRASYACALSLARAGEEVAAFYGECFGEIVDEPKGAGGFGYDPYFFVESENATFAQIEPARKNELSHRGIALRKFAKYVRENRA